MKWFALILRVILGAAYLVFGLNYFKPFFTMEGPKLPDTAMNFIGAMAPTGYLDVVKALEVAGGALLLTGRFAPLGLVILTPISVNIMLWDLCFMKSPALGTAFTAMCVILIFYYRRHFAGVFAPAPIV